MNIVVKDNFYVDLDTQNKISVEKLSPEYDIALADAKEQFETLISCFNCTDCRDCIECFNCTDCHNCMDCRDCIECRYCMDCLECTDCTRSNNCTKCNNSRRILNCHQCTNATTSIASSESKNIRESISAIQCSDTNQTIGCTKSKQINYSIGISNSDQVSCGIYSNLIKNSNHIIECNRIQDVSTEIGIDKVAVHGIYLKPYLVKIDKNTLQIGCQQFPLDKWEYFPDDFIRRMEPGKALTWWQEHKQALLTFAKATQQLLHVKYPEPNSFKEDIPVKEEYGITYDPKQQEYYNCRQDTFLSEEDITFYKLKPYDQITNPLPNPLPADYFLAKEPTIEE